MVLAIKAARFHADRVVTRDAELRSIWDEALDNGTALQAALKQGALLRDEQGMQSRQVLVLRCEVRRLRNFLRWSRKGASTFKLRTAVD